MSTECDIGDDAQRVDRLLARAAARATLVERRNAASTADLFLPDDARLTDRERAVASATLAAMVDAIERDVRAQAVQMLGESASAIRIAEGAPVFGQLASAGAFEDHALIDELLARTRLELLADGLPEEAADEPGTAGLLTRLGASGDAAVAQAASALMASTARRHRFLDDNRLSGTELPADLHHRLTWWVTAAIRDQLGDASADRALTDAALRQLSRHDESGRVEATAMRLAAAIDAQPGELPVLLVHAVGERQVALFAALLAIALRLDFPMTRELVIDRDAALWLALRAIGLDRATIARLGLMLARDVEAFADELDAIMRIDRGAAYQALARYALHPDLRTALGRIEAAR